MYTYGTMKQQIIGGHVDPVWPGWTVPPTAEVENQGWHPSRTPCAAFSPSYNRTL